MSRLQPYEILIRPLVTEKSSRLREAYHQISFRVHPRANRVAIREAVEDALKVQVESVRVMNVPGKTKTLGRFSGRKPGWRKAIVTLKEGEKVDLFER